MNINTSSPKDGIILTGEAVLSLPRQEVEQKPKMVGLWPSPVQHRSSKNLGGMRGGKPSGKETPSRLRGAMSFGERVKRIDELASLSLTGGKKEGKTKPTTSILVGSREGTKRAEGLLLLEPMQDRATMGLTQRNFSRRVVGYV